MTQTTLRDRLSPAVEPVTPTGPDGVDWRPATSADIDAMHDAAREADAVDHPHFTTPREEIASFFELSHVDPARDTMLALDAAGEVLGFGWTVLPPEHEDSVTVYVMGGVRPSARGRGIGRRMLDWQVQRATQKLAAVEEDLPAELHTYAEEVSSDAHRLLERGGFRTARYFLTLTRVLADPIPEPPVEGYEVRSPGDADEEGVRLARNDSFRDHWGSQPRTAEEWGRGWHDPHTRLDLSSIAAAPDGSVAAFVRSSHNPDDSEPQGYSSVYVDLVGTARAHRRRGLAPALLARTMRLAAASGLERAVLDVDAENPTGALGLYTGLGFTEEHRSRAFVRDL